MFCFLEYELRSKKKPTGQSVYWYNPCAIFVKSNSANFDWQGFEELKQSLVQDNTRRAFYENRDEMQDVITADFYDCSHPLTVRSVTPQQKEISDREHLIEKDKGFRIGVTFGPEWKIMEYFVCILILTTTAFLRVRFAARGLEVWGETK